VSVVVETARLRLRCLGEGDAAFILELLTDPDFLRNVGDRGVRNEEDALRYIANGPVASYGRQGFGLYLVELREPAVAIGMCGLLRRDTHPDVEIGFALLPRFRGRGYALEAARATLRLGIETYGLQRLVAITAPDNGASIDILEALGLRFERLVRFTEDASDSRLFVFQPAHAGS
jgi:RimJ/RimL family protein N-acetyltransferase